MIPFKLLRLNSSPIYEQLLIEEALLRTDTGNWCLINTGSPPAIVLGISGKPEQMISPHNTLPVIRRFSGGGTVVVDENTTFVTFIVNNNEINIAGCPKRLMEWSHAFYKPVFGEIPYQLQENDYAIGLKKIGGNAQYLRKDRWLHHTTFLWDYMQERMESLQHPPKMPAYRANRPHSEFLSKLKDYFPSREEFHKRIEDQLRQDFRITVVKLEDLGDILERPHRRVTTLLL